MRRWAIGVTAAAAVVVACGGRATGSATGGGGCVSVDPSAYDRSCRSDADCVPMQAGEICDGTCACGNDAMNASEQSRYEAALAGLTLGACFCSATSVACVGGRCSLQGGVTADAGSPADAAACVNVDASTYDASCSVDTDCTSIRSGLVCSGQCGCGGDTPINVDGVARYQVSIAGLELAACPCVAPPPVRCVAKRCTVCGFGSQAPGCGDGG